MAWSKSDWEYCIFTKWHILEYLRVNGPSTCYDIMRYFNVRPSAVHNKLERMRRSGGYYVKRRKNPMAFKRKYPSYLYYVTKVAMGILQKQKIKSFVDPANRFVSKSFRGRDRSKKFMYKI